MANILIVDDSPTDVHVMTTMLEKHGYTVLSAENAEDGIEKAKSEKPDLVIMDVILPGMNGFQATRALSKNSETSEIPIIIVSTKNMETDRVWGLRQGAKDYLAKPFKERELIVKIKELLEGGE